jgi:hypothetical protein
MLFGCIGIPVIKIWGNSKNYVYKELNNCTNRQIGRFNSYREKQSTNGLIKKIKRDLNKF